MKELLLGFAVGSLEMLRKLHSLGIANFFELRSERMGREGMSLLERQGERYQIIDRNVDAIAKEFPGVRFSAHLPVERSFGAEKEYGLNMAVKEHWPLLFERLAAWETICRRHGIIDKIVIHPSLFHYKNFLSMSEDDCLQGNNSFLRILDAKRQDEGYQVRICLENLPLPREEMGAVGYRAEHFARMLEGTSTIETMFDTGHANLNESLSEEEYREMIRRAVHIHFHGNSGKFNPESVLDDQHLPPHRENLRYYDIVIDHIRKKRPSVVFELQDLSIYSDEDFVEMVEKIKKEVMQNDAT
jgi:hypothetical protein